ncbi:MAG: AAA family ATPase [Lysobacterales bacterium]
MKQEGGFLGGVLAAKVHGAQTTGSDAEADRQRRARRRLVEQISNRFHGQSRLTSDGGLLAIFDSVNAAATAAVTLQRQFPSDWGEMSCAVSGGEIFMGIGGFSGEPVENALKLIHAGEPGLVLLGSGARSLAGSRLEFPVEDTQEGQSQLRWQPRQPLARELKIPAALAVHDAQPFIGRKSERVILQTLLEKARSGDTQWCSVVAAAGLGKTRLLADLASHAADQGVVIVGGAADEDLSRPFAPVAQGLELVVNRASDLATRLGPGAGDLVRLLPAISQRLVDLPQPAKGDSHSERQALFSAVAGWLCALAAEGPLLLMLDSLHWEGDSTFELLNHILGPMAGCPIFIVTSHRHEDSRTAGILAAAREKLGQSAVTEMVLGGLDAEEVEAFLRSSGTDGNGPSDTRNLHSVVEITGGSPLHLMEVIRNPSQLSGGGSAVDLQSVMSARFSALERSLRRVLEVASVVGEVFELKDVAAICGVGDDAVEALDQAVEERLVQLIDPLRLSYRFVHSITREAVYAGLGAARKAQLHHRAGRAVEAQGQTDQRLNDLARHYVQAAALDVDNRAVDYCLQAGNQALNQFANEMALSHFEQGLALLNKGQVCETEIELKTGAGRAQRRLGVPGYRRRLFAAADSALALRDGQRMAVAVYAAYRGSYTRALHVDNQAVTYLRQALDLLDDEHVGQRAQLLALLAIELTWSKDRGAATEASEQAIEVAQSASPDLLLQVLTHALWVQFHPTSRRLTLTAQVAQLMEPDTDPRLTFEMASHQLFTACRVSDRQRLERALSDARALARSVDQPGERSMLLLRETTLALMQGRFREAMVLMTQRRQLAKSIGEADGEAAYRIHQYWLAYEQAEPEQIGQLVAMAGAKLEPHQRFFAWPTLLMPAVDCGQNAMASEIIHTLAEEGFQNIPRDQMWLWNLAQLAYGVNRLGLAQYAETLLELLSPALQFQANMVFNTLGSVARYVGLLKLLDGDTAGAERHLEQAVQDNDQIGAVTWAARCRLDLALLANARGEPFATLVAEALDVAVKLKMPLLRSQIDRLRVSPDNP